VFGRKKLEMPTAEQALPGRDTKMSISGRHAVLGTGMQPPFPDGMQQAVFGMGCFWGAERRFWNIDGVHTTAVGYAAGITLNPTYEEVCSGLTAHNEVVLVVFDPSIVPYQRLLQEFWESHNPTQGMRQGNDVGTQYRSGIYTFSPEQQVQAQASRDAYASALSQAGLGGVTTEILPASEFYYAEEYHQQYLAKNPHGYCGLGGTGVCMPAAGAG